MKELSVCFVLCAWVLWQEFYVDNIRHEVEVIDTFNQKEQCQTSLSKILQYRKNSGKKVDGANVTVRDKVYYSLICVPDTVKMR